MFATGIENSIPTINDGKTRVDQMEASDHYRRWREDFDLAERKVTVQADLLAETPEADHAEIEIDFGKVT